MVARSWLRCRADRSEFGPMLLPAHRVMGDDGTLVSQREISESSGVSLELLQRLHRAVGLVRSWLDA